MLKSVASILISKLHQYSERLWARYDSFWIYKDHKVLFIDLGANLGQGFTWFKRYFHQPNIFFELFELKKSFIIFMPIFFEKLATFLDGSTPKCL